MNWLSRWKATQLCIPGVLFRSRAHQLGGTTEVSHTRKKRSGAAGFSAGSRVLGQCGHVQSHRTPMRASRGLARSLVTQTFSPEVSSPAPPSRESSLPRPPVISAPQASRHLRSPGLPFGRRAYWSNLPNSHICTNPAHLVARGDRSHLLKKACKTVRKYKAIQKAEGGVVTPQSCHLRQHS